MRKATFSTAAFISVVLAHFSHQADAFTIQFDYTHDTGNFFASGSPQRDRLLDAGSFFESLLGDDLLTISPQPGDSWSTLYTNPTSGGPGFDFNPVIPADTIIVYVGARDLGGSTLGEAGPGGRGGASGSAAFIDAVLTRGETGDTEGPSATDFSPWGGNLAMDLPSGGTPTDWDYSIDDSTIGPTQSHFYSVLLHEIGHILGVGTADSWDAQISGSNEFFGAASVLEYGSDVPLQSPPGHWSGDTDSGTPGDQVITSDIWGTTDPQEVAMDPSIIDGTTKYFTNLDVAALADIGWEINPIPEPAPGLLAAIGLVPLALRRRR
jgi:hypothetical protein